MKNLRTLFLLISFLAVPMLGWAGTININTATAVELAQSIKGVGKKKAMAIIAYRKQHGPFKSIDELARVKGIGKKTVESNRENMTIE